MVIAFNPNVAILMIGVRTPISHLAVSKRPPRALSRFRRRVHRRGRHGSPCRAIGFRIDRPPAYAGTQLGHRVAIRSGPRFDGIIVVGSGRSGGVEGSARTSEPSRYPRRIRVLIIGLVEAPTR